MSKNCRIKDSIVFLDAGTVDFGDLSLQKLHQLGDLRIYPHSTKSRIKKRVRDASIIITNKCIFDRQLLKQLPQLKCLCISATGTNNVDLEAAKGYGVAVTNVTSYTTDIIVQYVFTFILALAGNLKHLDRISHSGEWSRSPHFMVIPSGVEEIQGKTLGILGYGTIGKRVEKLAKMLGMKVLIGCIPGRSYTTHQRKKRVTFDALVRRTDYLTLHLPLTRTTRDLINGPVIRKMKKGACLINMARGGIVNEQALRKALDSGHLKGAAVDVLTQEPPPKNHVLLGAKNLLLTPHSAWSSLETRTRLVEELALNIRAFQQGKRRRRLV